jgi:hypothetical protein
MTCRIRISSLSPDGVTVNACSLQNLAAVSRANLRLNSFEVWRR